MKKIGRIGKGEDIICQMVTEDIQDLWDKVEDLKDEAQRAREKYVEEHNQEVAKEVSIALMTAEKAVMEFWFQVHSRYGHWLEPVGIRDGYALVRFDKKKKMKMFADFFQSEFSGDSEPETGFTKGD